MTKPKKVKSIPCHRCKQPMALAQLRGRCVTLVVVNPYGAAGLSTINFDHPFCLRCVKEFKDWWNHREKA